MTYLIDDVPREPRGLREFKRVPLDKEVALDWTFEPALESALESAFDRLELRLARRENKERKFQVNK